jgi:hypothetical protein
MASLLNRRSFLGLTAGCLTAGLGPYAVKAQEIILRPDIQGTNPRYAAYATPGDFIHAAAPLALNTEVSKVFVFYPEGVQNAQIIVFSHGALSDPFTYRDLLWHWASHGFVVVAPLHDDAIIKNGPSLRKLTGSFSDWPIPALLEDATAWSNRLLACRACLDMSSSIKKHTGIDIDFTRPVIAGHGYGAYIAALAIGATVLDENKNRRSFRDTRFFSAICLSPQGPGVMGLDEGSWVDIKQPMLSMVAENEIDFTGQPWQQKGQSFKLAAPGYKHFGMLKGGTTNTFSGQKANASNDEAKLYEVVKAFTTGFLEAYTDYDPIAFKDMKENFFQRMSLNVMQEYRR